MIHSATVLLAAASCVTAFAPASRGVPKISHMTPSRLHATLKEKEMLTEHFFLQQPTDPVMGKPIQKHVSLQQFPTKPLQSLLLKAKSSLDSRVQVLRLSDLLRKCCALDPTSRISLKDALQHEFFLPPPTKTITADTHKPGGGTKSTNANANSSY